MMAGAGNNVQEAYLGSLMVRPDESLWWLQVVQDVSLR
jgi:hypothetical protein